MRNLLILEVPFNEFLMSILMSQNKNHIPLYPQILLLSLYLSISIYRSIYVSYFSFPTPLTPYVKMSLVHSKNQVHGIIKRQPLQYSQMEIITMETIWINQ